MKKVVAIIFILICIFSISTIYATNNNQIMNNETENQLVQIKDKELKTLEDYKESYGNDTYGIAAYALNIIRI